MSRRYKRSNNCLWPFLFHSNDEKMIYPIWCRRDLIICKRTSRSIPFSPNGTERADFLQHRTVFADDDALMAGFFAINSRVHVDDAVIALREFRDFHRRAVRDFPFQIPQQLFPDDLRDHLALRLV